MFQYGTFGIFEGRVNLVNLTIALSDYSVVLTTDEGLKYGKLSRTIARVYDNRGTNVSAKFMKPGSYYAMNPEEAEMWVHSGEDLLEVLNKVQSLAE